MRRIVLAIGAICALLVVGIPQLFPRQATAPQARFAAPGASAPVAAPAAAAFSFRHLVIDSSADAPEACLRFSAPLAAGADAHPGDYLRMVPAVKPALRVQADELCLGGLSYGVDYTVTLLRGLPAASGARLGGNESVAVSLGDRAPLVDISGDGFVLPRAVAHGLTIQTVNVRSLRIHVLRISEPLLQGFPQNPVGSDSFGHVTLYPYGLRDMLQKSAVLAWTGTMRVAEDHNRTVQTAFPLAQVIKPGQRGAYLVVAEDAARALPEQAWNPDGRTDFPDSDTTLAAHWVIATDIGLTAFSGTDGLTVSAHSLATAQPLADLRLALIASGQETLAEDSTGEDGTVHFAPGLLRGTGAAAPSVIVAHGESGDVTVLNLQRPAFDFSDRGVTGRPSPGLMQAYLYTERGIYRPGQTVELMALLRDRIGRAPRDAGLTLVLRRPNGMEARRFSLPPAPMGGFHQAIPLTASAALGQWSVEALADPAGAPIGRVSFAVQDFVPQQLKVTLAAPPALADVPGTLPIDVQGDYLYGAPAAGLAGEAEVKITRDADPVPGLSGWSFGLVDAKLDDQTATVKLPAADARGMTHGEAALTLPGAPAAPVKAVITAGLFDPAGRIVNDTHEVKLKAQAILIGLRTGFAGGQTDLDRDAATELRVYDAERRPVARRGLSWILVRENPVYDWFRDGSDWRWHYHVEDQRIATGSVDAAADRPARIVRRFAEWGDYRLVVQDAATGVASSIRIHAGWGESPDQQDVPDKVTVTAEARSLAPGATTHVHIVGPFAGPAQVVIANDRVLETRNIEVPAGGTDIAVTQNAGWGAGAYVLVTMLRPLQDAAPSHVPARAVGLVWIATEAGPHTLGVTLDAPARMRPQRDLTVGVQVSNVPAGESAYVTLAAVDEGILQLTKFASPDPLDYLFGKRALGVLMRDDYGKLLDGSADPGEITGGDEGLGGAGLPVTSIRTVALFSGPVRVDASGHATITLAVPDFEGQLRLMAVAYSESAVGRAQATEIVRDPVVADIAMPRFLATGDEARLGVQLNDTDGPAGDYRLRVTVAGALALTGPGEIAAALQPGARHVSAITVHGLREGVATIDAALSGPGDVAVHRSWQIAVRAPHYPITLVQTAWQKPGETYTADPNLLAAFVPGSLRLSLGYSAYGGIDVPSLIDALWGYPFGCTEQLASIAASLLYYSDGNLPGKRHLDPGAVHARVQQAIDTILDRQDDNGVFGLWRVGDGDASAWLNIYALDMLMRAKEAGFVVPQSAVTRALAWLRQAADGNIRERFGAYYAADDIETRAYAAYLLARTGRADLGALRRMHDSLQSRPYAGVALYLADNRVVEPLALGQLSGALALMGDRPRAEDAMRKALANLHDNNDWPGWWFDFLYVTPERDGAQLLAIAADIRNDEASGALQHRLEAMRFSQAALNTQDRAALLQAAHRLAADAGALPLAVNGAAVSARATPALDVTPDAVAAGYSVRNTGERPVWRTLSVTGAPLRAGPAFASGFSVEKQFTTLTGGKLDPARLRQNDRALVVLHGFVQDRKSHRTVIVDLLPAGWEIEAPVVDETQYGFLGPLSKLRVREARDDRFVAALDFGPALFFGGESVDADAPHLADREFRLAYLIRAITPGHFTLPETVVQDMYRPEVMGRSAAGSTDVLPP